MLKEKRYQAILSGFICCIVFMLSFGIAVADFVDNGDGTVSDTATGLIWQQTDDGLKRNWQEALSYCEALILADKIDWRLPNIRELQSIVDDRRYNPAIDSSFNCNTDSCYWAGSTNASQEYTGWLVHFLHGESNEYHSKRSMDYVRCVRVGKNGLINPDPNQKPQLKANPGIPLLLLDQ